MKKFIFLCLTSLILISCDRAQRAGNEFVEKYYPDFQIIECEQDNDGGCDLKLMGDVEIDIDRNGEWTSVEDPGGVPDAIVPVPIKKYVNDNYMGRTIVKIEREDYGYEVDLYKKIRMRFDHEGNFIELIYKKVVVYDF